MKFVPLSESDQNQTEEGGKTLRFVPLADDTKPKQFVPLKSESADSGFDVSDPMGTSLPSAIASAPPRKKESVLEGMQMPAPLPTEDKMLRPEFVAEVESRLNALPANKRQAALERMTQRTDVYGRAAKVVAGRYAALDAAKGQAAPLQRLDPRLEAQTLRFIDQGMEPEAARNLARQQAQMGEFRPDLQQMRPDIEGEIADREAARRRAELEGAGFLGRVGAEAKSQATLGGLGLMQVYADITGDKQMQRDLEGAGRMEEAGAAAIPKGEGVFERSAQGAIASLATQTPMLALSVLTGTAAPVLIQAGVQQFGSSYGEARRAGLSPEMAATRAAPMAAAEVIFERFGMESALAGLRKFVADKAKKGVKVTGNEIAEYFGKAVAKEIPPELATTATQYGIDILPGVGLNRNPSLVDLYQQLEETLRQTVIQAGTTAAVAGGATKGAQKLAQALTPKEPSYKRDVSYEGLSELLARSKGFLVPETQREQAPPAVPPVDLGPVGEERPGVQAPVVADRLAELTQQGIDAGLPEDDARIRAQNLVALEAQRRQEALAPRIEELTQEYIDAGTPPETAVQLATAQAQEEAQADEIAEGDQERVGRFEPLDVEPTGAGVAVAGQPGAGTPAAGVGDVEPTGVVSAGQAPATVAGREEAPPTPVDEHPAVQLAREMAAKAEAERGGAVDLGAERARQTAAEQTVASDFAKLQELAAQGRVDASEVVNIQNMLQRGEDPAQVAREIARVISEASKRQAPVIEREEVGPQEVAAAANEPKKRGRPAVLTEEEKQQRAEAKRPLNAQKMRADRAVARLNKTLDTLAEPFDPGEFDSEEEAAAELDSRQGQKRKAVQELLTMQSDPALRGTKVAERIKAALAHPSITPKELADLKAGLEAVKRAEGVSRATVTRGKPDPAFSKFTNGAQALSHIIKTGSEFQKMLGKRLRAFVGGVKFVVIEEGQELPAQLQKPRNARQWERSIALYIENYQTGEKVIYVRGESFGNDQGVNNVTILHELLHAATNRKIMLAIDAIQRGVSLDSPLVRSAQDLLRTMNSAIETYNDMASKGQLSGELVAVARSGEALTDPREFIAYGMTDEAFQQFLMKAKGQDEDTAFFTRFVRGVRELFGMAEDTTNALSDLIKATDSILSSRAPRAEITGEVASSAAKELPGLEQVLRPLPPVLVARGAKTPSLKRRIDALRRRRDAGQLTDTQFAEEVDAIAETVESAKYQKIIPTRQRGADYIRQRILEAKRRGDISEEAADLAEWFILQNPALVDDLSISFRQQKEGGVGGEYLNIPRIARIIKESGNTGTIVHEVLHHLERMMPEPIRNAIRKEWYRQFLKAQDKAADDNQKKFFELLNDYHSETGVEAQFKAATTMLKEGLVPIEFYQYVNPSEFWAVNGTRIVEGNFAGVQGDLLTKLKNWLANTAQKLKGLFGLSSDAPILKALDSLAKADGKFVSTKLLQEEGIYQSVTPTPEPDEATRSQKELSREFLIANEKFNQSKSGEEYAKAISAIQMLQDPRKVAPWFRANWNNFSNSAKSAMTRVAPTDFLADVFSDAIPELRNTDNLMQKMQGMVVNLLKSAGKLTQEVDRAYRKDPALREKLDRITHVSTLMEVDPSDPNAKEREPRLDAMWNDLGEDGQRMYRRIKNHFEVLSDYFTQLLDEQITQSGLPLAERSNLLAKVRAMYETGAKITPFFPLVRRGDFWLSIGSGKTRKFFMFETLAERDAAMQGFADERVKQKPGESDAAFEKRRAQNLQDLLESEEYTVGNELGSLRRMSGDSSELLKGVFQAVDASNMTDPDAREELKDAIYQLYLQTMPEQSFRRQFIHRKGVTGFRTDVLRNTADATSRMAVQLARLKYGRLLRNSISQARDSITNRTEYEPIVAAFERRVREELNPKPETMGEKVSAGLNKAAFIWYLGGASSALLQPLSVFQTGLPVLSKYGFGAAMTEMGKMLQLWNQFGVYEKNADGTTSFVMPTVEHASGLTPEERRAVRSMSDFNLTTTTYANDVFNYKNTPSGNYSSPIVQFGKDTVDALVLGGLMHTTERISREAMFLSSFRLNRKAGKSFEESVDQAVVDTKEALGNYGEYNRPEFMRGAVGKLLTQFMMYPVHVTLFLGRNFGEMIKPMGGRTRQEARRKFFGTLGTSFILAGAVGLPMFSTVMGLLGWMWEQFKEDDDPEDLKSLSFELWFRTVWLQEMLGETKVAGKNLADLVERGVANAITGLDISSRTSLNNLWMRDTKETATVRDSAAALALEKAGPAANMVLSWAEAYEAFIQGDYSKGVKKALPAGFRNFANSYELFTKGAKDNKGTQILSRDAFTTGELIGQAVGFRPDALANMQNVTFKVIGLEQKINNERTLLLRQLDREFRNRNMQKFAEYIKERNEFNRKYPSYAITDENLSDSLEGKAQQRAESYRGFTLTEKNITTMGRALVPSRKEAAEKERKGREGK